MSEQGVSYTSCFFVTLDILIYWDNFLLILRSVVLPKGHRDDVSEATPAPRAIATRTSSIIIETLRSAQGITAR